MEKRKKRIIDGSSEEGNKYPIQPAQIDTKKHFHGAFCSVDMEVAARVLVDFAQRKGCWMPFTMENLKVYGNENFKFYGLSSWVPNDEENYIIRGRNQLYYFTHEFIMRCAYVALIF